MQKPMNIDEEVVNTPLTEETGENPETNEEVVIEETTESTPLAGEKTDPNLLLKSLKEEREKRRIVEEENKQLKSSNLSEEEVVSDEGRILAEQIRSLQTEVSGIKELSVKEAVLKTYPVLKDKWSDFEVYRSENAGMSLETAAKAYLVENGLFTPTRKGLEKPTGGPRSAPQTSMTAEDVANLRTTNYKKYQEMVRKGQLKFS